MAADLWERANDHLLRYGGEFVPLIASRAEGAWVHTIDGRSILDFTSGQMCATLGHNHPRIVEAVNRAGEEAYHLFSGMLAPAVIELADRLADLLPDALSKVMLLSTGGESNEAALRLARLHTGGFEVLGFSRSWHGMTAGAASLTYSAGHKGYGPATPGTMALPTPDPYRCPIRHCRDACDQTCLQVGMELYDAQSVGAPAAVIVEPILSSGGVVPLPDGYLASLAEMCRARGMVLVVDEAQTGLGRTGEMFAFEREGVVPDVLTLSKTLGGGLPLAATITSEAIEEDCHAKGFLNYTSHVSDPLPARAGLAVLDVLASENLAGRAAELGAHLRASLTELQARHEVIGDVRGRGLMLGVELVGDRDARTPAPELTGKVTQRCLELGLHVNIVQLPSASGVLRIAPPLTSTRAELDTGVAILDRALTDCTT
ncbi:MAG: aspartate aminotransferase family protein [Actinomycetota bacterium]|nr:aspartate aminotransferase family protein [Actinomycetota bacterium]